MALPKKDLVEINGKEVRMSEVAFKIASKHFGARKIRLETKEVPIELRKAPPKLEIVPPAQPEVKQEVSQEIEKPSPIRRKPRRHETVSGKE